MFVRNKCNVVVVAGFEELFGLVVGQKVSVGTCAVAGIAAVCRRGTFGAADQSI